MSVVEHTPACAAQRDLDGRCEAFYARGAGRLFWDHFARSVSSPFAEHVSQLIAEVDREQETQQ